MTDTSGPTSGKQFAYYDPDSQSWRMWPATGLWGSIAYSGTWPRTGYMSDGQAYELPTSVPPHHRERLFILAAPADTEGARRDHGPTSHVGSTNREKHPPRDDSHAATDAEGERLSGQNQPRRCAEEVTSADSRFGSFSDTDRQRRDGRGAAPEQEDRAHAPTDRHSVGIDWGPYAAAVRRWERLTRPAPAPTELNRNGKPRLNAEFASWMMGLPEGHVTQVPGISRADQLKAIGNGVCPQQAAAALTKLLEMEGI